MSPSSLFQTVAGLSPWALIFGFIGAWVGWSAFEPSVCRFGTDGCIVGSGSVFGMTANSQADAAWMVGVIAAVLGIVAGALYRRYDKTG